jgi:hypothetical protein
MRIAMAAVLLVVAHGADAQQRPRQTRAQAQVQRGVGDTGRAQLEGAVRRGFARAVRERVGLSEEQMRRLVPVTQRYERDRRALQLEERNARVGLRGLMRNEQTADPKQVEQFLQRLLDVEKRRVQLLEAEQRDLSAFMTPVQRTKFMALQEQIRRRLAQSRQRRNPLVEGDAPADLPPRRPPLR